VYRLRKGGVMGQRKSGANPRWFDLLGSAGDGFSRTLFLDFSTPDAAERSQRKTKPILFFLQQALV